MATFVNCTPHPISVRDVSGNVVTFAASGNVARVSVEHVETANISGFSSWQTIYGEIQGLPLDNAVNGEVFFIVSSMVLEAAKAVSHPALSNLVAPATGHSRVERNEKGHVLSVPGFVRA